MNKNPTDMKLRGISKRIISEGINDSMTSTTEMVDDILELVDIRIREAIEDIHPHASGNNDSTSMQKACLAAAAQVLR